MTHQDITIDDYHQGDALEIRIVVEDSDGDIQDITGGAVEWLLKDSATDDDADAHVHKHSANGPAEVELTDPANGEAIVHVDTGDTGGLLDDPEDGTLEQDEFHHRARLIDADGNRSTIFHGSFTINI